MPLFQSISASSFKRRPTGKLASTNIVNELADAVDGSGGIGNGQKIQGGIGTCIYAVQTGAQYKGRTGWNYASTYQYPLPSDYLATRGSNAALGTNDFGTVTSTSDLIVVDPSTVSGVEMVMLVGNLDGKGLAIKLGGGGGIGGAGQYPGQVWMTVANNTAAWEYPRAVTGA